MQMPVAAVIMLVPFGALLIVSALLILLALKFELMSVWGI